MKSISNENQSTIDDLLMGEKPEKSSNSKAGQRGTMDHGS
jgi:hypothetical protein